MFTISVKYGSFHNGSSENNSLVNKSSCHSYVTKGTVYVKKI